MRIRSISPRAPKDEDLADLKPLTRLIHQWLPMLADRAGRLVDRPRWIKAELLPHDNVDMEEILAELAADRTVSKGPFIIRYEVDGVRCIEIQRFHKYQTPHKNEPPSSLPPPPKGSGADNPDLSRVSLCPTDPTRQGFNGIKGSGDQGISSGEPARRAKPDLDDRKQEPSTQLKLAEYKPSVQWLKLDDRIFMLPAEETRLWAHIESEARANGLRMLTENEWRESEAHLNRDLVLHRERRGPRTLPGLVRNHFKRALWIVNNRGAPARGRGKSSETWANEQRSRELAGKEAASIAKCPRDHERQRERLGHHWACPDKCGWTEVIRVEVEEQV